MRVLLPFYRPDSSDNSDHSSSDEEQDNKNNNSDSAGPRARGKRTSSRHRQREKDASSPTVPSVAGAAAANSLLALPEHPTKVEENTFALLYAAEGRLVNFEPNKKATTTYRSPCQNENKHSALENSVDGNPNPPYDEPKLTSHPTETITGNFENFKQQKNIDLSEFQNKSPSLTSLESHETNPRKRSSEASSSGLIGTVASAPIDSDYSSDTVILPDTLTKNTSVDFVSKPAAPQDITADTAESSASRIVVKRPRTDSKPPAKDLSSSEPSRSIATGVKMAVGGSKRRGVDSDDEGSTASSFTAHPVNYWVRHHDQPPAENEPPIMQNQPPPPPAVASVRTTTTSTLINPDDPAQDLLAAAPINLPLQPVTIKEQQQKRRPTASLDQFRAALKQQGLEMVEQEGDGNCLFRAVSLQVYGQSDNHAEVRERCLDFMAANAEHYSNFVADEDRTFPDYIARKRRDGVHGNHAEIQAISELFNRPVEVYSADSSKPMNIFHAEYKTSDPPIRLSYHDGNHYNAVVDPLMPTAGLGLGLPGLKPGLADKLQLTKAKTESDQYADEMELERILKESAAEFTGAHDDELQRVLKESSMDYMYAQKKAMTLSDLDETNFELEQKVLASSLESFLRNEHGRKQRASPVGRRRGSRLSFPQTPPEASAAANSPLASMYASAPPAAAAAVASAPSVASVAASGLSGIAAEEEYPQTIQELVMNGFELSKVIHAYDLIGDNFDDLLAFLLSSSSKES